MLTDVKGKQHAPFKSEKTKAVVFVFMLRDCPVSNVYAPELTRIHKEYSAKGVALYLVHPDRDTNAKSAIAHAKEYKLIAPVVLDHDHKLTRLAEAEVTPEAAVFDAQVAEAVKKYSKQWQRNMALAWTGVLTDDEMSSLSLGPSESPHLQKYLDSRRKAGQAMGKLSGALLRQILTEVIKNTMAVLAKPTKNGGDDAKKAAPAKKSGD